MISTEDITVVIQGKLLSSTVNFIEELRATYPSVGIVVSCWEGDTAEHNISAPDVVVVESSDPGAFPVDGFKLDNITRQLVSTKRGLERVRSRWAIKIRSDITFDLSKTITCLKKFSKRVMFTEHSLFESKVIATALTTLKPDSEGHFFHVCDWIYAGLTVDLQRIFNADTPDENFFQFFRNSLERPEICSRYRSETYLIYHLVRDELKVEYPYSTYYREDLAKLGKDVLDTNFYIVNHWGLGLRSFKHKHLWKWYQSNRYTQMSSMKASKKIKFSDSFLDLLVRLAASVWQTLLKLKKSVFS